MVPGIGDPYRLYNCKYHGESIEWMGSWFQHYAQNYVWADQLGLTVSDPGGFSRQGLFGPYCIHTTHPLGYVVSEEITPVVARQNPKPPICFRPFFLESISNRFRCHPPNLVHGYRTSIPTGPQVYLLSSDTTTMGFPPEMFYHFWV